MKMKHKIIAAFLVLFSAGCGKKILTHDSPVMRQNFARELQECKAEAAQIAAGFDPGNIFIIQDETENCMKSKGYYEVNDG